MWLRDRRLLIVMVLLTVCGPARAQTRILIGEDETAEAIRDAAADLLGCIADGDRQGARAVFDGPPQQVELLEVHFRLAESSKRLRPAIEAQVGKLGEKELPPTFAAFLDGLANTIQVRAIALDGDAALMADFKAFDGGFRLKRVDGAWKVTHLTIEDDKAVRYRDYLAGQADASEALLAQVAAGKVKTIEALGDALELQRQAVKAAELKWLDMGRPGDRPAGEAKPAHGLNLDADQLRKLFGQHLTSDDMAGLIAKLPGTPLVHMILSRTGPPTIQVVSREGGVELTFPREPSLGSVILHSGDPGFARYAGKLPEGLSFDDRRQDVERKIGRPFASSGNAAFSYEARYEHLGLFVKYQRAAPRDPDNPILWISWREPERDAKRPAEGPPAARLAFRLVVDPGGNAPVDRFPDPDDRDGVAMLAVSREVLIDGSEVADVSPDIANPADMASLAVSIEMTPAGARKLQKIAEAHNGRRIAIVFDGQVLIAPAIRGGISDRVIITLGPGRERHPLLRQVDEIHAAITALPTTRPAQRRGQ